MPRFCLNYNNDDSSDNDSENDNEHFVNTNVNGSFEKNDLLEYSDDDNDEDNEYDHYSHSDDDDDDENDYQLQYERNRSPLSLKPLTIVQSKSMTKKVHSGSSCTRYTLQIDDDDDEDPTLQIQQYPPLQSYRNATIAPIRALWKLAAKSNTSSLSSSSSSPMLLLQHNTINDGKQYNNNEDNNNRAIIVSKYDNNSYSRNGSFNDDDDDISRLAILLRDVRTSTNQEIVSLQQQTERSIMQHKIDHDAVLRQRIIIQREMKVLSEQFFNEHMKAKEDLYQIIKKHEKQAQQIKDAIRQQEEEEEQVAQAATAAAAVAAEAVTAKAVADPNTEQEHGSTSISAPSPIEKGLQQSTPSITQPNESNTLDTRQQDEAKNSILQSPPRTTSSSTQSSPSSTAITPKRGNVSGTTSTTTSTRIASSPSSEEDYVVRANKLRLQLVDVQKSVQEYDTSNDPFIKQKRLQYKKLVNGKVNTLAENAIKIRQVAQDVSQAIIDAKNDDARYKEQSQQQQQGNGDSKLYTLGKRYLINLLSSKVIVRIQAEGFNGQRGDGFPLAHMLCIVATNVKDIVPVLTAHIYSVCPTAIPALPSVSTSNDDTTTTNPTKEEDDFMIQLGMIRGKDGNFESFERFLSRTEGIISLVANIMASEPSDHLLFGGNVGAVKWLKRFLSILPPKPISPLPLITAPVLDAFLTGAGHMMANVHTELFDQFLKTITNDICTRLDESSIGMPSATRLRKTIRGGIQSFKQNLPSRALPELYCRSKSGNTAAASSFENNVANLSPFGKSTVSNVSSTSSPFGSGETPSKPMFGTSSNTSTTSISPFGLSTTQPSTPFGSAPASSPFGAAQSSTPFGSAPASSPFGAPTNPANSTVGSDQMGESSSSSGMFAIDPTIDASQSAPFGSATQVPTFGNPQSLSFGGGGNQQSSPFGGGTLQASPFGSGATQQATPFGSSATQQAPPFGSGVTAPFGSGNSLQTSPFGSGNTQQASPFGGGGGLTSTDSPFAGATNTSISPFGTTNNDASKTAFGSNTNFSSFSSASTPFGSQQPTPFSSNPSPFGSAASPAPSIFGSTTNTTPTTPFGQSSITSNPSPFGSVGNTGMSSSPFGSSNIAPSPSPFSNNVQQPFGGGSGSTPFGGGTSSSIQSSFSSPFGGGQPTNSTTPFGGSSGSVFGQSSSMGSGGGRNSSSTVDSRPPCKFFAMGNCKYGANCNFSHSSPYNNGPVGGGQQFGSNNNNSPFGGNSNASYNPFGGPRR